MINIEYSYFDVAANEKETKDHFTKISKYNISVVSLDVFNLKIAQNIFSNKTKLATIIDYPCGLLDPNSRIKAVEHAINAGTNIVEMVLPSHFASNRKYDKFRSDVKNIKEICLDNSISLRYILDYRIYSYGLLYRISQILSEEYQIFDILLSTGYGIDDIYDNIIAGALIKKKVPKINPISNGNIWLNKHIEAINKAEIDSIRFQSINSLDLMDKNYDL